MIPWVQLDTATVPGEGETLRLMQRGQEYSIMAGANELMNSRLCGSEQALAALGCDPIKDRPKAGVLIGGLGMGFTLRAAQALLAPDAEIAVAELAPAVIAWAKGPLASLYGDSLADARVTLHEADVDDLIRSGGAAYDAILLDVDNGPRGLSRPGNDGLYSPAGLSAARHALRPGGVLAVWSAVQDTAFSRRLRDAGLAAEEVAVRAYRPGKGARHVVWVAVKSA
jgi:spermidine synthase